jgi:polysaccharide pyruvyl transferase WcaK-like protein
MRIAVINDTSFTRHYGCMAVMKTIFEAIAFYGHEIAFRWPVGQDWWPAVASGLFEDVDLVVVNGEGTIHHSTDRPQVAQLCRLGPYVSQEVGVPVHLLNATIESLDGAALSDLREFSSIHVRENSSKTYLAQHGLESKVVPDLSLSRRVPSSGARKGILVTDSIVKTATEALRKTADEVSGHYFPFKKRKSFFERLTFKRRVMDAIYREGLPVSMSKDLDDVLTKISTAEVILTGRFHALCMGILCRTPFIAIESNSHKISGMAMDVFGSTDRVYSIEGADSALLASRVGSARSSKREIDMIASYLSKAEDSRNRMWGRIL